MAKSGTTRRKSGWSGATPAVSPAAPTSCAVSCTASTAAQSTSARPQRTQPKNVILTINAMDASAPTRTSARRGRATRRCKPGGWRNSCGPTCAAFCTTLESLREHQAQNRLSYDLEARRNSLAKRLAAKQAEKDRFVRLYARGKILDEEELETYLANVVNQVENLKQLISSVEADLARAEEDSEVAASAEAWLMTLRENLQEVEADTQEAFDKRRELVRLLVDRIAVSRTEEGRPRLDITYRFGPPTAESAGECVDSIRNSGRLTGEMYFGA